MQDLGTTFLLPPLDATGDGRRAGLERELREAIRSGRLRPGAPLPSTRTLARQAGVSRRLVVEAYSQLAAEGYLVARRGSGTRVAPQAAPPRTARRASPARERAWRFDLFPGSPDLTLFPRQAWLRATRAVLAELEAPRLSYAPPAGMPELREAVAEHAGRVRGALAHPDDVVVTSGYVQALRLVAEAVHERGGRRIAVEDPGFPIAWGVLGAAGLEVVALPVDDEGIRLEEIDADAALVTPAHQFPTGVVLSSSRRAALIDWARARGALVIEDDFDAQIRHDRDPVGTLQGLAPDVVALIGTVSKTLAPGVRVGWLVAPEPVAKAVAVRKALADLGSPVIDQLVLARLLRDGSYDRHVRACVARYRLKRAALLGALAEHLPDAQVRGVAAGLHALAVLPAGSDEAAVARAAEARSVRVYPLSSHRLVRADGDEPALILGYAGHTESELAEAVRLLAEAVAEVSADAGP